MVLGAARGMAATFGLGSPKARSRGGIEATGTEGPINLMDRVHFGLATEERETGREVGSWPSGEPMRATLLRLLLRQALSG